MENGQLRRYIPDVIGEGADGNDTKMVPLFLALAHPISMPRPKQELRRLRVFFPGRGLSPCEWLPDADLPGVDRDEGALHC